jgi:hypothetical protein
LKAAAEKYAKSRTRYGYAHKIIPYQTSYEGKKIKGYKVYESQRPVRHTWWQEHLPRESTRAYLARMKRRGIKAYIK